LSASPLIGETLRVPRVELLQLEPLDALLAFDELLLAFAGPSSR
jgi:hypothetical protein